MRLHHKGMTIELEEQDPRVAIIEALLFGRSLPPPFPVVGPPAPDAASAPAIEVPAAMRRFWEKLIPLERRELLALSRRSYKAAELEAELGVPQRVLMGRHSRINRMARKLRLGPQVFARGRTRAGRTYYVTEETAKLVGALVAEPPKPPAPWL